MIRLYRIKLTPYKNGVYHIYDMNEMREIPESELYKNFDLDEADVLIGGNLVKTLVIYKYKRDPNKLFIEEKDYEKIFLNDII